MSTSNNVENGNIILSAKGIQSCYGKLIALKDVNFHVFHKEILGIVGPNGAGKTTLMESIAGTCKVSCGTIMYKGINLENFSVHKRRHLGILLIPQDSYVFPLMSVKKNLEISMFLKEKGEGKDLQDYAYELFPILHKRKRQIASTLSGGQQKMLAVAMAIVSNAELLLIDEPSIGVAPKLVTKLFDTFKKIRDDIGKTIVLAEQNIKILNIADRLFGLEAGQIRFDEKTENLSRDVVKNLYMGLSNGV